MTQDIHIWKSSSSRSRSLPKEWHCRIFNHLETCTQLIVNLEKKYIRWWG